MWNMFYKNNIMYNYEGKTNGIKNLLIDSVLANYWVFPTDQIAEIFSVRIDVFFALKDKNVDEMLYLTNLHDTLLPLLMNGQVTLSDIENTVDSVISFKTTDYYDQKFNLWLQSQGLAARGDMDRQTLRKIFDTMDDNDK
jgi:type I restriction enzyme S subunit